MRRLPARATRSARSALLAVLLAGVVGFGAPTVVDGRAADPPGAAVAAEPADSTGKASAVSTGQGDSTAPEAGPSAEPSPSPTPLPLAGFTIAIDPGHNGGNAAHPEIIRRRVWIGTIWKPCNKVGTTTRSGWPEHRFNWLVASRVKARLESLGATVRLTRTSDSGVGPCISTRGRFGAKVGAALAVSIHGDGSLTSHRGFFVMRPGYVKGWTDDILHQSKVLAVAVRGGLKGAGIPIANYYAKNGIIARTDLGTLNFSNVPIVQVELGNMKNATDAARMRSSSGRDQYARGLVAGIRRYLGR